jgi:hypothetical protein
MGLLDFVSHPLTLPARCKLFATRRQNDDPGVGLPTQLFSRITVLLDVPPSSNRQAGSSHRLGFPYLQHPPHLLVRPPEHRGRYAFKGDFFLAIGDVRIEEAANGIMHRCRVVGRIHLDGHFGVSDSLAMKQGR